MNVFIKTNWHKSKESWILKKAVHFENLYLLKSESLKAPVSQTQVSNSAGCIENTHTWTSV